MVLAAVGGSAFGLYRLKQGDAGVNLPVAPARKGDFLAIIRCRGDLKAGRSAQIYTPIVPNLRIAWMAPAGEDLFSFNQMGCKNNKDQENTEPRTEWIFLANSTACGVSP